MPQSIDKYNQGQFPGGRLHRTSLEHNFSPPQIARTIILSYLYFPNMFCYD